MLFFKVTFSRRFFYADQIDKKNVEAHGRMAAMSERGKDVWDWQVIQIFHVHEQLQLLKCNIFTCCFFLFIFLCFHILNDFKLLLNFCNFKVFYTFWTSIATNIVCTSVVKCIFATLIQLNTQLLQVSLDGKNSK